MASAARLVFALFGSFFFECRPISSHASCQTERFVLMVGSGSCRMRASIRCVFLPGRGSDSAGYFV